MVVLKGQIRLPVQTGTDVVEVDFIVVDVFSIHGYYEQTLASYPGGSLLYSTSEGKVPIRGPSFGDSRKSGCNPAMPGSGDPTSARGRDLGYRR